MQKLRGFHGMKPKLNNIQEETREVVHDYGIECLVCNVPQPHHVCQETANMRSSSLGSGRWVSFHHTILPYCSSKFINEDRASVQLWGWLRKSSQGTAFRQHVKDRDEGGYWSVCYKIQQTGPFARNTLICLFDLDCTTKTLYSREAGALYTRVIKNQANQVKEGEGRCRRPNSIICWWSVYAAA